MKKYFFLLFTLVSYISQMSALSTSVIIPCYYSHFKYLEDLLDSYNRQTVIPDEIIISISCARNLDQKKITALKEKHYPYRLTILCESAPLSAGENRNRACKQALGDLIICQDADDLPHPQRVEIIKFCFSKYPIPLLIHKWTPESILPSDLPTHIPSQIPIHIVNNHSSLACFTFIHNGNIALRREVCNHVSWPDSNSGEDVSFNNSVLQIFGNIAVIDISLLIYRNSLSSLR